MSENSESNYTSLSDLNQTFTSQMTWELFIVLITKFICSLMFLIDDLTFIVFCQYEFKMT